MSSRDASVKRIKNGTTWSSQKTYELEKKEIEWRRRIGVVHEMRSLEMRTHTPELKGSAEEDGLIQG